MEVENVVFAYPDGQQALRGVTLGIEPGEKVALVGQNGAGKSTFLLHLNGILRPTEGRVRVAGMDVVDRNLARVRGAVGLVFQMPDDQLFSPTVFDDVAFGPIYQGLSEVEARARVLAALQDVGMDGFAERPSHHLSIGQKKRVAIASVLVMRPEILALDEPTAGLDPRSRRGLIHLLRDLPLTMLVSTHDLPMARELLPRTVVMENGRIVADGPTARLLNDPALLSRYGLE
ncbi:MAG: energy-coupling factor ABC transporter ATP-binding protein [Thermoflexales bacterium]|nr:energy-coupling factor ABC transporter ATP-binding protein [Thermoflexales bacterium]